MRLADLRRDEELEVFGVLDVVLTDLDLEVVAAFGDLLAEDGFDERVEGLV